MSQVSEGSLQLSDAVKLHPNSLVGFTLFTNKPGYKAERAMVLVVESGKVFDVLSALQGAPRLTSQFVGWLKGRRIAVVLSAQVVDLYEHWCYQEAIPPPQRSQST